MGEGRRRREFPEAFKREAVERVRTSGMTIIAVAEELGLHETVLRRWIQVRRPISKRPPSWGKIISERRQPMTRQAVNYLLGRIGERARLGRVRPHMLRHSCSFALANRGHDLRLIQDYLGHRDPRHTAHYTRTAAVRFDGLWER